MRAAGLRAAAAPVELRVWLGTRVGALVVAGLGVLLLYGFVPDSPHQYVRTWDRWDVQLFRKAAAFGYDGYPRDYPDRGIVSFFPGLPLLLRALHPVVPNWTLAAMLLAAAGSLAACLSLARLARLDGAPPGLAVTLLTCSPWGVFLVAGYSEALFLGLALPAWTAARRGRWATAGLLCGAASLLRVSGLFVCAGLLVAYLLDRPAPRWRHLLLLSAPAAVAGWFAYLWHLTGDPLAWFTAEHDVYRRSTTWPWSGLERTVRLVTTPGLRGDFRLEGVTAVLCVLLGVVACVVLVRRRRWPEVVYLGLTVAAFATSSLWYSVGRSTLLWWPAWTLLAGALAGRRWTTRAVVGVSATVAAVQTVAFVSGYWIG